MHITVELFGTLRDFRPPGAEECVFEREITSETTVADVLRGIEVPEDKPVVVLVNSLHAEKDQRLAEGDFLHLMVHMAGG